MHLSADKKQLVIETLERNDYLFSGTLGKGGDGEVFLVKRVGDSAQFAIKCFNSDRDYYRLKALKGCSNLVYPVNCIEVEKGLYIYFMEKCTSIQSSFPSTKDLLLGILDGIEQLNEKGFEQKDDFDGNILLKKNQAVAISDFSSFSKKDGDSIKKQIKRMLTYVQQKRNIKKLVDNLTEADMGSMDTVRTKIQSYV